MKRLLLITAFGLLASPVLAQNNATVSSTGTGHNVNVNQSGALNDAGVTQTGAYSDATISQVGASHQATISQAGSLGADSHTGSISQFGGNSNEATITQSTSSGTPPGSVASITQDGSNNWAIADQIGTSTRNNSSTQTQVGENNEAWTRQTGASNIGVQEQVGNFNDAGVEGENTGGLSQAGNTNYAEQRQFGDRNWARSLQQSNRAYSVQIQTGSDNRSNIQQGTDAGPSPDAGGYTYQTGDFNDAEIIGQRSGMFGKIEQIGDGNWAQVDQGGSSTSSFDNIADFLQDGNANTIGGLTAGSRALQMGSDLEALVVQEGDENVFRMSQNGIGHTLDVEQIGNGNTANVQQSN